jgi:hypothetical protein
MREKSLKVDVALGLAVTCWSAYSEMSNAPNAPGMRIVFQPVSCSYPATHLEQSKVVADKQARVT